MHGFDVLLLAFKGIAIASLPLAIDWIGRSSAAGGDPLRRLAWVTVFLTFDLIVFGAFTRLTDSGLGCPDWPGCYAKANPWMAAGDIRNAEAAMPYGPVTMNKAWIEMIHRYLAMAVGLLIVAMVVVSVRRVAMRRTRVPNIARSARPARPALAVALLVLVVLQGAFGAWTVTQRLQPIFVTTHLCLGLTLLALLVWHALGLERGGAAAGAGRSAPAAVRWLAVATLVVAMLQVTLGGWVSANYAVLACGDFPTCGGAWVPEMNFAQGFDPSRPLGRTSDGALLPLAALTAIHWVHRAFAWVVFVLGATLAWRCRRISTIVRPASVLAALLVAQFATGVVSVVFAWPLVAAVLHNAGAAALIATVVVINYRVAFDPVRASRVAPASRAPGVGTALGRPAG